MTENVCRSSVETSLKVMSQVAFEYSTRQNFIKHLNREKHYKSEIV